MVGHRSGRRLIAVFALALSVAAIEGGIAALALLFDSVQEDDRVPSIVALAAAGCGGIAAVVGFSAHGGGRRATAAAVAVMASQVVVAGVLGSAAVAHAAQWRALGLDTFSVAVYGTLAATVAAIAVWSATTLPARRWALAALAAVAAVFGAGVAVTIGAVAVEVTGADCDRFAFDRERWRAGGDDAGFGATSDRERIARTLRDCDVLDGRRRDEVRDLLGPPSRRRAASDQWIVGWTNDLFGPGDGDSLVVRYDGAMRVSSVRRLSG